MIYVIITKHAKFSYSSIESQLLPCAPVCGYKFHALAVYLRSTFTDSTFLIGGALGIQSNRCGGVFFVEIVDIFRPLAIFAKVDRPSIVDDWLDSSATLFNNLLKPAVGQAQNQKMKSWTDSASSFYIPETVQVFSNTTTIT